MACYKYVIIGGGMTASAAVQGIREIDPHGDIAIFTEEMDPPYDRPPLSRELWKDTSVDRIWRRLGHGVELHLGTRIGFIDLAQKSITDDTRKRHMFEKLLLATGGRPRRLPSSVDGILYFRTLQDYRELKTLTERYESFAIVGAGFLGPELAAALVNNGRRVTMVTSGATIASRLFPKELGLYVDDFYRRKGIELRTQESVVGFKACAGWHSRSPDIERTGYSH